FRRRTRVKKERVITPKLLPRSLARKLESIRLSRARPQTSSKTRRKRAFSRADASSDEIRNKIGHIDKRCSIKARRDGHDLIVVTHRETTTDQAIHGAVH